MEKNYENIASELIDVISEKDMSRAKSILKNTPPSEIVRVLVACEDQRMAVIFRLLDKDTARTVFELIDPPAQAALIESFTSQETIGMLSQLDADELVRILDELPARVAKRLMEGLPKEQRSEASRLMGYADDTVGRLMSQADIIVREHDTAQDVLKLVRVADGKTVKMITNVYVVDEKGVYVGAAPLSVVVSAEQNARMQEVASTREGYTLRTGQDQEEAARLLKRLDALELPVLDSESHLVGVLTATDAMDIIQEEVTDDIYDKAGLVDLTKRESDRSFNLIHGGFWHVFKQWVRESLHGIGMGAILGVVGGVIAQIWQGVPGLGMAVGLALGIVIALGAALGFVVPYVLLKLGFDQAAGADPIITTIKDMAGLVIYFFLVKALLPEVIAAAEVAAEVI